MYKVEKERQTHQVQVRVYLEIGSQILMNEERNKNEKDFLSERKRESFTN